MYFGIINTAKYTKNAIPDAINIGNNIVIIAVTTAGMIFLPQNLVIFHALLEAVFKDLVTAFLAADWYMRSISCSFTTIT